MSTVAKPLAGIKVLDISRVLAGPWCGQMLADMGAEVIKVERPQSGDDTRHWGPPWLSGSNESAYYLCANRGKRSVTVDMAKPEGQALIKQLAAQSDVVLENFKVGGLKKYGLDYASLKALNPGLVYCSITGFGQQSPYAHRAGYDFMIQAMGGLMSLTGQPDGEPGGGPVKVGVAITDIFTGLYAANAVLAALYQRRDSGEGCHIDLALMDVQVGVLANQALNYLTSGQVPQRLGNAHPNIVPYQVFKSSNGSFVLAVGNDQQFRKFCTASRLQVLCDDPRFITNTDRLENRDALILIVAERLAQEPTEHWIALLEPIGVPCASINRLDQAFVHPQVVHRELQINLPHTTGKTVPLVANPIKFSQTEIEYTISPPMLGEHTKHILNSILNIGDDEISRLEKDKIIYCG
mgnify:CR=1 FL=1